MAAGADCPKHDASLNASLELLMDGEVTREDYAIKRRELHERQAILRLQLEVGDQDNEKIADLAIKAFELSPSLKDEWLAAD